MKQILENLRSGEIEVVEVPCPRVRPGHLLIQTRRTLISPGTERMLVEFAKGNLIAKARSQPEKVKQVLDKMKTDGILPTLEAVFNRLDEPMPPGYCNAGAVVEVGAGCEGFQVGDRVASNGFHAEMACVPVNLCAPIPDGVSDEHAAFTVLGSIGLHGTRLLQPTLGESFAVIGLGLIGQIAIQLLKGHGCSVVGVDTNEERCALARSFGVEAIISREGVDPVAAATAFSGGDGVDGVLITASAKTDAIIHQAAQMCRKRGRIVLTGVVGLNILRSDFYEKELSFQVSAAYGPGRYDPSYEEKGIDYPLPYVRWTVARNFRAILGAIRDGILNVEPLISRRFPHDEAGTKYYEVLKDPAVLGAIMEYPEGDAPTADRIPLAGSKSNGAATAKSAQATVGVIGAGNFAKLVLLPAIKAAGANLKAVASAGGVSSTHAGKKFDAEEATTDYRHILRDDSVSAVFITTRHNAHAGMVIEALEAGKHVFVEKPLAVDATGLQQVTDAYEKHRDLQLMVGFNRRFAPFTVEAKRLLAGRAEPVSIHMMVNAGMIPADHWIQDSAVGGGRIIGEGCHFIDLLMYLVGRPIRTVYASMFDGTGGGIQDDKMSISLTFADGSIGTVHYWSNGPKSYPKERVEIFSQGRTISINNWRRFKAYDWPGAKSKSIRSDKGHKAEVAAFVQRVRQGGEPLIPFDDLAMVTQATFAAMQSAKLGKVVDLRQMMQIAASAEADAPAAGADESPVTV